MYSTTWRMAEKEVMCKSLGFILVAMESEFEIRAMIKFSLHKNYSAEYQMSYRETRMRAETRLRLLPQPRLHSWKWRWWETLRCRCILEVEVTRDTVWWTGGWGRRETNQEWSLVFWPPQPRERPLMPVKENSGPGRRKPDFRFGHVESEMPTDVSEALRDWLEHVWVTNTERTAWALREKCAELTMSMYHVNVYLGWVLWSMPTYAKEVIGPMANQSAGPEGDDHLAPTGRGVCPVLQDSIIWGKKLHIHIFI